MAQDFVELKPTGQAESQLPQLIKMLRQVVEGINDELNNLNHMVNGTDYSEIETKWGLSVGQGQTLYNLVAGANVPLQNAAIAQLTAQVA